MWPLKTGFTVFTNDLSDPRYDPKLFASDLCSYVEFYREDLGYLLFLSINASVNKEVRISIFLCSLMVILREV